MDAVEEVRADFMEAVGKIDFGSYDPFSSSFDSALRIGLMWRILRELDRSAPEEVSPDGIAVQIEQAKRLLQKSIDTGDPAYKTAAMDALKSAGIQLKKAYSKLPTGDERKRLREQEAEIQEISREIGA